MWSSFTNHSYKLLNKDKIIDRKFIDKVKQIRKEIYYLPDVEYTITKTIISNSLIKKYSASDWVSTKLTWDYLPNEYQISWNNNNIYIKTTEEKFTNFTKRLNIFLKIINYINKNKETINIYLILSDLKKDIEKNKIISPNHINSGYTNTIGKYIFIWRDEEFEKVTFHEILHLLDHDHRHEDINLDLNIDGPTSYYEAITDFKAILYNVIYMSIVTHVKLELIFNNEYNFIYNQAKYVNNHINKNNKIKQNSPAYSYFVLKFFIFKYFSNMFDNKLFNELFYNNINYVKLIDKIKKYELNENDYINFNSARMTLHELK